MGHIPHDILQRALKYAAQAVQRRGIHRLVLPELVYGRSRDPVPCDQSVCGFLRLFQRLPEGFVIYQLRTSVLFSAFLGLCGIIMLFPVFFPFQKVRLICM